MNLPPVKWREKSCQPAFIHPPYGKKNYPRVQILTIEEILNGAEVKMPPSYGTFKKAERVKKIEGKQGEMGI
jgi:hypothetical protein